MVIKQHITYIKDLKKSIKDLDLLNSSQIDENSIKSNTNSFEIILFIPFKDIPKNKKVYEKLLCFSIEKHAYFKTKLIFNNIKNSDFILNKDEHDEAVYIKKLIIDEDEKIIKFDIENSKTKYINIEYENIDIDIEYNKSEKIYIHKRLRLRLKNRLKKFFKIY